MKNLVQIFGFLALVAVGTACKKDAHVPPKVVFKTGADYTSSDASLAKNTTIKVGITADKVEDDLKTLNVSYAYDGATTTTTSQNFDIPAASIAHFEQDVTLTTRNKGGVEKWTFTVTDKDGNITPLTLTLTVQ